MSRTSDVSFKVQFIPPVFSAKYENERKTVRRAVYEEYQAFKSELSKIQKSRKEFLHSEKINKLMQTFKEHYIETSALLEQLKRKDTLDVHRKQSIKVQYLFLTNCSEIKERISSVQFTMSLPLILLEEILCSFLL